MNYNVSISTDPVVSLTMIIAVYQFIYEYLTILIPYHYSDSKIVFDQDSNGVNKCSSMAVMYNIVMRVWGHCTVYSTCNNFWYISYQIISSWFLPH
jgi:hypothetical protein